MHYEIVDCNNKKYLELEKNFLVKFFSSATIKYHLIGQINHGRWPSFSPTPF
jgi:hypothetical protein